MVVQTGSVAGLMGPNGAGKTTLVNLISGLLPSDSGTIRLADVEIQRSPSHVIAELGIARTYQNVRLFSGMTVLEQVMAGCYVRRGTSLWASFLGLPKARAARKAVEIHALELLDRVQLANRAHLLAETLSYGEQRRVEIARALGTSPRLLLLDEPTNNLDPPSRQSVADALSNWKGAIILVSHDTEFVEQLAPTKVLLLPDGQVDYFSNEWLDLVSLA